MKFRVFNDWLYYDKTCIGYIRYIDYHDNGRHGYGISKIKNQSLLKKFENDANIMFPNAENPYIDYLDKIYMSKF